MRLIVTTPLAIVVDDNDVVHLRAEDETGLFGILAGHANFLTALAVSVVSWRNGSGKEHHVAVRGGILEIRGGKAIAIATREAVPGDDLHSLESEVVARFHRQLAEERRAREDAQRLYLAAIRQICHLLRPGRFPARPGAPIGSQPKALEE